jgi:hypothetical protein
MMLASKAACALHQRHLQFTFTFHFHIEYRTSTCNGKRVALRMISFLLFALVTHAQLVAQQHGALMMLYDSLGCDTVNCVRFGLSESCPSMTPKIVCGNNGAVTSNVRRSRVVQKISILIARSLSSDLNMLSLTGSIQPLSAYLKISKSCSLFYEQFLCVL